MALTDVAKAAARILSVATLTSAAGHTVLLQTVGRALDGSACKGGQDTYSHLKTWYRVSRTRKEYVATMRQALAQSSINGGMISSNAAGAIVLDQDANQQPQTSTVATAVVHCMPGSDCHVHEYRPARLVGRRLHPQAIPACPYNCFHECQAPGVHGAPDATIPSPRPWWRWWGSSRGASGGCGHLLAWMEVQTRTAGLPQPCCSGDRPRSACIGARPRWCFPVQRHCVRRPRDGTPISERQPPHPMARCLAGLPARPWPRATVMSSSHRRHRHHRRNSMGCGLCRHPDALRAHHHPLSARPGRLSLWRSR